VHLLRPALDTLPGDKLNLMDVTHSGLGVLYCTIWPTYQSTEREFTTTSRLQVDSTQVAILAYDSLLLEKLN